MWQPVYCVRVRVDGLPAGGGVSEEEGDKEELAQDGALGWTGPNVGLRAAADTLKELGERTAQRVVSASDTQSTQVHERRAI